MTAITDKLSRATDSATGRPIIATLAAPGKVVGAPSITLSGSTNWTTATPVYIALYTTTAAGIKDPTSQTDWKATLSGTTLSNMTLTGGVDRTYAAGAYVEITFTSAWAKDLYDALSTSMNPDGSLKTAAVQTALNLGTGSLNGWNALGFAPATVAYTGNRSYTLTFNGIDLTPTLSAGMRLRTTRTVAAPTQSTSLNGTSQFYSKTAPAGMTFTNNFVVSAWVKLNAYNSGAPQVIASRYNGTSGWELLLSQAGQVTLVGRNAAAANLSQVQSYQSLPLNKWVHVAAQLDMLTFTATPTTSYVMIDGVDVPAAVSRAGTNPTALLQAGNVEIGSENGGTNPFNGKIAQVAIYSAKVTEAAIQATIPQGLAGTETNLISAYSFNNSITDLNTTNANNLTANGSAVATNADSPYGAQADGTVSSTLDYAIIQKASFSTNTTIVVQVPEGGTIPTSGGVASVVYSSSGKPYGMPVQRSKWQLVIPYRANISQASPAANTWYNIAGVQLNLPVGEWDTTYYVDAAISAGAGQNLSINATLSTSTTGETDATWSSYVASQSSLLLMESSITQRNVLAVSALTPYYFIMRTLNGGIANLTLNNGTASTRIIADNAYL